MDITINRLAFLQKQRAEAKRQLEERPHSSVADYLKHKAAVAFFENWIHELERGVQFK